MGDDHPCILSGNLGYSGWNSDASNVILIILMISSVVILINILGIGVIQKSGRRVFYLLNGMCLSQPSSLYQRCFLFPLLKGPGFPTVFPEIFPCSKDFSRPSVFPQWRFALKAAKKIKNKIKSRRQTHTPGKNTCDRRLQICIKHAMCFSQWYVPVLIFFKIFIFIFSPPEVPERNLGISSPGGPVEEPLKHLLLVFFSLSSFRRPSCFMGILETDTWPEQDHKRESTLAQTFE